MPEITITIGTNTAGAILLGGLPREIAMTVLHGKIRDALAAGGYELNPAALAAGPIDEDQREHRHDETERAHYAAEHADELRDRDRPGK